MNMASEKGTETLGVGYHGMTSVNKSPRIILKDVRNKVYLVKDK